MPMPDSGECSGMPKWQAVAELMTCVSGDGPFLSKNICPVFAVPETSEATDVLPHAVVLVVRFFDQKTVVLNARLLKRRRNGILLGQGSAWKNREDEDQIEPANDGRADLSTAWASTLDCRHRLANRAASSKMRTNISRVSFPVACSGWKDGRTRAKSPIWHFVLGAVLKKVELLAGDLTCALEVIEISIKADFSKATTTLKFLRPSISRSR